MKKRAATDIFQVPKVRSWNLFLKFKIRFQLDA